MKWRGTEWGGRFLSKFDRPEGQCWAWRGTAIGSYGAFKRAGKQLRAHRVAYELFIGSIPDGLTLDHLCRNRLCVNPAHLEAVTGAENTLRGFGWSARNARKTHCPQGHEFSTQNTLMDNRGARVCRECNRARCHQRFIRRRYPDLQNVAA